MDKERRARLQRLWLKFLENITDYKGIIDGLFAEGVINPSLKEKVVSIIVLCRLYWFSWGTYSAHWISRTTKGR